jgi:secondary thiamine-phosphate synthase enzyme
MISVTRSFTISTRGKGLTDITSEVGKCVTASGVNDGTATVFIRHTSASLVIFENADPSAAQDLLMFFERLVPEDGQGYDHTLEGADDMTSHVRMVLTRTSEVIPIGAGRLMLGTWQGIFLFEHRRDPHRREIVVNVTGSA